MVTEQRRKAVICLPPTVQDDPDLIVHLIPVAIDVLAEREQMEDRPEVECLGNEPFVLIRISTDDTDSETAAECVVEYGGGLGREGVIELLAVVLEQMNGECVG